MESLGDPRLTCHSGTRASYLRHCTECIYRHLISLEIVNRNHEKRISTTFLTVGTKSVNIT